MSTPKSDLEIGYQAALVNAAFYLLAVPGTLRIGGDDRAGFIQRQTTNDVRLLRAGKLQLSVLTNPAARILDVFHLLAEDESLVAITLPGQGAATAAYLKSRIFYMDKVTVTDLSEKFAQVVLTGPGVPDGLKRLGIPAVPDELGLVTTEAAGIPVRILGASRAASLGIQLLLPTGSTAALLDALVLAGFTALDETQYDLLRVEAGLPANGRELSQEYTPLETGLAGGISESKGCYTGQEIIARQITHDKVTQRLCGVRLEQPARTGQRLWVDGRPAGTLTSTAISPRFGAIALAVAKRPYDQPGTHLKVGDTAENGQTGLIAPIPFI